MLLTQKEMLEQWRLRHCLDASGLTGTADDQFDRMDSDLIELAKLDDWYAELISRGDSTLVPPTDITPRLSLDPGLLNGEWEARLPDDVITVIEVNLSSPARTAEVIDRSSRLAMLMTDEFAPIPTQKPIAIVRDGYLKLFYESDSPVTLRSVMAIVQPRDGFYSITQKGLALIPKPDLFL